MSIDGNERIQGQTILLTEEEMLEFEVSEPKELIARVHGGEAMDRLTQHRSYIAYLIGSSLGSTTTIDAEEARFSHRADVVAGVAGAILAHETEGWLVARQIAETTFANDVEYWLGGQ